MNGKLKTQYCPGVNMQERIPFAALKHVCWINLQREKRTECVKLQLGMLV